MHGGVTSKREEMGEAQKDWNIAVVTLSTYNYPTCKSLGACGTPTKGCTGPRFWDALP